MPAQAAYMKRRYIGFELNPDYVEQCNEYLKKTLNEGLEEYSKSLDMSRQNNFEEEIVNLRVLKFGRVLLRKIEEHLEYKNRIKVYVDRPSKKDGKIIAKYAFAGICDNSIYVFISEVLKKQPLSKFGIVADISIANELPSCEHDEYYYSRTNSYSFLRKVSRDSDIVAVISSICVDYNESDY